MTGEDGRAALGPETGSRRPDLPVRSTGLDTPIQFLKGIGPQRARLLERVGVRTVRDLLLHVPRRYVDRSATARIGQLSTGDEVTVFGRIIAVGARTTRGRRRLVSCIVGDGTGSIEALWFNRPDLKDRFRVGQEVILSGKVTVYRARQMVNPAFETPETTDEFAGTGAIIPMYPLTEGLSTWVLRRAMRSALDRFGRALAETLPGEVLTRYGFPAIGRALEDIHFPSDVASAGGARARLAYEELFYLELLLALRHRQHAARRKGRALVETGVLTRRFRELVGFEFTAAQRRVIGEILADMGRERRMNRLLQGDVGSGKTVIAIYAMLVAVESGGQAAMMAPTEILATQHYLGWRDVLAKLGVETRLLTGSTRAAGRREALAGLAAGTVGVVFGTHALIEGEVRFRRLALAVIDEQHRFGVMQRAALLAKDESPDFLVMTATPIPRTLVLTFYGDLDVSLLDEKPPGRIDVVTRVVPEGRRHQVYGYIEERLASGEQAFVVCPIIEESEKLDLVSAVTTFAQVQAAFPRRRVGLMHGRMPVDERDALMARLRRGELDILVSTTVIEVGVDIPGASVMLIEHPERFGLAQLHQLRGRVGRGGQRAVCVLMAPSGAAESMERLQFFAGTSDGFRLAEKDLELRGPGEILGTRQSGLPDLKVADIIRDNELLDAARQDAFRLVEIDPELCSPGHAMVRAVLVERYAGRDELMGIG
jgi:ATP-dependent DNA helicase RecG